MRTAHAIGFTLIELMIVVSIISILTMIALPSYQHYTQRARFSEVLLATEPFKIAVSLALQQGVSMSELSNNQYGIPPAPHPTKNLTRLSVEQGIITATSGEAAGNATYILKPNAAGNEWAVSGTCLKTGLCHA